jgi:hypothetical protein
MNIIRPELLHKITLVNRWPKIDLDNTEDQDTIVKLLSNLISKFRIVESPNYHNQIFNIKSDDKISLIKKIIMCSSKNKCEKINRILDYIDNPSCEMLHMYISTNICDYTLAELVELNYNFRYYVLKLDITIYKYLWDYLELFPKEYITDSLLVQIFLEDYSKITKYTLYLNQNVCDRLFQTRGLNVFRYIPK